MQDKFEKGEKIQEGQIWHRVQPKNKEDISEDVRNFITSSRYLINCHLMDK